MCFLLHDVSLSPSCLSLTHHSLTHYLLLTHNNMNDEWAADTESPEDHLQRPIIEQTRKLNQFTLEHETIVREIELAIGNAIAETPTSHYKPLRTVTEPVERIFPQDLIVTDNDILHKVLTVVIFLCDEINELNNICVDKFIPPLVMFGQTPATSDADESSGEDHLNMGLPSGKNEKMLGQILPLLQELSNFVDRCYSVSVNFVQQLSSLLNEKEELYKSSFQKTHLTKVFSCLGSLFKSLITLDCVIDQNESLKESWTAYKYMIAIARSDTAAFSTTDQELANFEKLLVSLDNNIMTNEIFKGCIEQNFEVYLNVNNNYSEEFIRVCDNTTFVRELLAVHKMLIEQALEVMNRTNEMNEREDVIHAYALYALYRQLVNLSTPPDPKIQKYLWGLQKQVPVIILHDKVVWYTGEFLTVFAPFHLKKPDPPSCDVCRKQYLQAFDNSLSQRVANLTSQAQTWLILAENRIQSSLKHEESVAKAMDLRGSIVLKGLSLANRASYMAKYTLTMHSVLEQPMTKSHILSVAQLAEILKAIEFTFIRKDTEISEAKVHIMRQLCSAIYELLRPMHKKIVTSRKLSAEKLDLLTSMSILQSIIRSSDTLSFSREMLVYVLSSMIQASSVAAGILSDSDSQKMRSYIKRLMCLSSLSKSISNACNTQFLYYHREFVFPFAVEAIYNKQKAPTDIFSAYKLQYLVSALCDGTRLCAVVMHEDPELMANKYKKFLLDVLETEIIKPLCGAIETDLRLHIHSKQLSHMKSVNPKTEQMRPLRPFLDTAPIHLLGSVVSIKDNVSHYLDRTFYNLTTVALHDWRTYSDMKALANEKYGLVLIDNYLPMGSLDQGLDILQIMRNIHIFVERFTYNMNTQQFVEFRPDKNSKHINTIKIQSIAASLRQHGLGVLNTTVNFTYQFLSQKFSIFSQFLFDDYIRAHLSREYRWYKKNKNSPEVNNKYPYDRAMKFVKDIRKLGVNDEKKTFLDQFRILITEIGNALGYVRMVRSASMYYCSEAVKFLPELDDIISFEQHAGKGSEDIAPEGEENPSPPAKKVEGANLSEETVRAGKNLDDCLSTLIDNFSEGSDYFKVLVNVFQSVLLSAEHDHLKTFFMIVPALCISWVEASLQAKESMFKATRILSKEMYFTDDGFAIGLSYCLAILKQTKKAQSLHWFDTVNAKHEVDVANIRVLQEARAEKDRKKAEKAKKRRSFFSRGKPEEDDEDDQEDYEEIHSLQLSDKRLEATRRETDQLFYSMSGASIFFKRTDVDT